MTKCFVWLPQGRLGNLIFQHQAISALSRGGLVLALDSEYFDLFQRSARFLVVPVPRLKHLRWRLSLMWANFFEGLVARKWIGTIEPGRRTVLEDHTWETLEVRWTPGYFTNLYVVKGFFQTPLYMDPLPRIKAKIIRCAEKRLADVSKPDRVAIHMRFGDYSNWPVFGVPGAACLPASYYVKALEMIKRSTPTARFFVFSDAPDEARAILESAGVTDATRIIAGGSAASDFASIASCSHAILSASSFSWWAASLISNPNRLLIAPKYWLGFRRKTWYPPGIDTSNFVYIDALSE